MKGHSGAAVFVNNRVVGLLRTAFLDESEKTMGGIVHATPIQSIVEFCNRLIPGLLALHPPVRWPRGVSAESPILADRKEEFAIFVGMITGTSKKRVLLLQGESGSGKTVLAKKLADYASRLGLYVAQADCKGTPALDSMIDSLLLDVRGVLANADAAQGASRLSEIIEDLAALDRPFLVALDTWQESSEPVRKWIGQTLLPNLPRLPGVVVLIGGQKDLPDAKSKRWEELAESRHLKRIHSAQDWFDYSRRKWPSATIDQSHVQAITIVATGKPNVIDGYLDVLQNQLPGPRAFGGNP
jgi:hypothetical protein